MSHRRVCLTPLSGLEIRKYLFKLIDLCSNLIKPRVKAVRRAINGEGGFLRRHDGQFGLCGHERILAATCAALEGVDY
ncbi:hypothetical protein C4K38_2130 [Pseudomonas chlororaphis subsp. piscium]|nr:hypothetical protein C4K38_2130 [Pseudomonas chlororaphis subsp. piscium]